jgi:hypothetical protein
VSLTHYSDKPLTTIYSTPIAKQEIYFKPTGLWVSVDGPADWKGWCLNEGFALDKLTHASRILLHKGANILRIRNASDLDTLTEQYGLGSYRMDWPKIATQHHGIIIAPYLWGRRLYPGVDWYYPWDCASGCIWNAAAVRKIIHISPAPLEEPHA